ncbi:MAG: diguanylate cyclase [Brevinematia bacterium]
MLEARELFVKPIEEEFLTNQYLHQLNSIFEKFRSGNKDIVPENIGLLRDVTRFVFSIEVEDEEVIHHWNKIFSTKTQLPQQDIRIVAFEYFLTNRLIFNPKIMEMERFIGFVEVMFQDYKTHAYNYHMLKALVNYEIEKIRRYGGYFSLLMIDLDNFKRYNDEYGHQFGDEILNEFSQIVSSCIRRADVLFRYGGDEFVVFCPETRRIGARAVAEKIRANVEEYFAKKNMDIRTSIGIAVFPFDGESFDEIIATADRMLYYSKRKGKNRVTDRFDFVEENDRRRFPRIPTKKVSRITIVSNQKLFEGEIVDISKSGILIKFDDKAELEEEIVRLYKITIGESEYLLEMPVKVVRAEGSFVAIDFQENKTLETLIYLFER